jgi:hypothetical protein
MKRNEKPTLSKKSWNLNTSYTDIVEPLQMRKIVPFLSTYQYFAHDYSVEIQTLKHVWKKSLYHFV